MTKITIVKNYRGKETLRVTELEEVVRFIQTSAYAEGQFLSRPEYKFESARKTSGWFYWVKERWRRGLLTKVNDYPVFRAFLVKKLGCVRKQPYLCSVKSQERDAQRWQERTGKASEN